MGRQSRHYLHLAPISRISGTIHLSHVFLHGLQGDKFTVYFKLCNDLSFLIPQYFQNYGAFEEFFSTKKRRKLVLDRCHFKFATLEITKILMDKSLH
jgi:hypothetical protein